MKYLIIIILFINCTLFPSQSDASKKRDSAIMSFLLCTFARAPFERYVSKDNMDGTVTIRIEKVSGCGLVNSTSLWTVMKKCLQGQVYRSAQNDCKGSGSSADYYGAQRFQWCPTNDEGCDDPTAPSLSIMNLKISPAGKSCANENLNQITKWEPVLVFADQKAVFSSYKDRGDEIPVNEYLWIDDWRFATVNTAPTFTVKEPASILQFPKSNYFYVLCMS